MSGRINKKLESPMIFTSFSNWIRLLWISKDIDWEYLPRILVVLFTTFMTIPLRLYENIRYGGIIKNTEIPPSPIFIVGHWRTGTTHLHNILSQDNRFGCVTTFQAMAPGFFLTGENKIKKALAEATSKRYKTRIIDNIPLSLDAPQEEDYAIANVSPYSFLHLYTFPRQAHFFFDRYLMFEDLPDSVFAKWKKIYMTIMRKATIRSGGKRLLIKNPANSGRLRIMLKLFPDAKFIHICRNPYNVFRSTLETHTRVLPAAQLQNISPEVVVSYVLRFYSQIMKKFLADKECIPAENMVELRYEDLEKTPLDQIRKVYEGLDIPGFDEVEPAMQAYIASIKSYKKNEYKIDDAVITRVNQNWQFAFDAWGYERLDHQSGEESLPVTPSTQSEQIVTPP